ncbi:methylamine utilization protein [Nitritalea halalkaliphila LW7]|uniref:Methylamine utilization protein n=1 Tax=Nitritalea halalkaliphila LW7 TaxID=1189621 RepID=I5BU52_9BACT|nr:methylamine utilization protein [Nitritalea halalkaliphila LW7]
MAGKQERMSDEALWGLHLFRTKAHCINCHNGPFFTDQKFHNLGLHFYGRTHQDLGRYAVTGDPADVGAFKTPSLRDVAFTAPYMHNGLFPHLEGVLNMYDAGMARPKPRPEFADDPLFPETSELLVKLSLTGAEKRALEAFLRSISLLLFGWPGRSCLSETRVAVGVKMTCRYIPGVLGSACFKALFLLPVQRPAPLDFPKGSQGYGGGGKRRCLLGGGRRFSSRRHGRLPGPSYGWR